MREKSSSLPFYEFFISNRRAILTFGIIGAFTALIYFLLFAVMWEMFHINYKIAVTFSYIGSILFHFLMNRNVTFQSTKKSILPQVTRYTLMAAVNYLITIIVVELSVKAFFLSPYVGVLIAVGITVVSGYLMSKVWVFRV